ncbi:50S ribosomal protein L24 [Haladaptatus sp. DJG-WS-42]|uniref:50S ribosomal protein L24 n=1 Tax=Haladaptatus sp. DJG-WS-42 TaxID=3120516 RepID=UPI0030D0EE46
MTRQPTKQRNQTERAPLHKRQRQVRATLSDDLREQYGKRNVRVNVGDTVEVMRGDFAGEEGEVMEVDLKKTVIYVEGVTLEKADGEEVPRALDTSNVRVTELNLEDDVREARLEEDNE